MKSREFPGGGLFVFALLVISLWGVYAARSFFIPVSISAILAFLMNPLVRFLERRKIPSWIAVSISAVMLILPLILVLYFIVVEIESLVVAFPKISASLTAQLNALENSRLAGHFPMLPSIKELQARVVNSAGQGIAIVLAGLRTFLETGSQLILVVIFTVAMLGMRQQLRHSSEALLEHMKNARDARVLDDVISLIERFLVGRLIIVLIIGLASAVTLQIWGMEYSFLLGFFVGVMTLVPELGFLVSLLPIVAVALATNHSVLGTVILGGVLFLVHTVEGYWLTPKLVGHRVNINVLATFLGLFAGGLLWGVWGMFLSVPILGVIRIALSASPQLAPWGTLLAEREKER